PEGLLVWPDDPVGRRASVGIDVQGTLRWRGGATQLNQGYAWQSSGLVDISLAAPAALTGVGINNVGPWIWTNTGTLRSSGDVTFQQVQLRTAGGAVDVRGGALLLNGASRW